MKTGRAVMFHAPYSLLLLCLCVPQMAQADMNEFQHPAAPAGRERAIETVALSDEDFDEFNESGLATGHEAGVLSSPTRDCIESICAGDRIRVIRGAMVGFPGIVINVNQVRGFFTILTETQTKHQIPARLPVGDSAESRPTLKKISTRLECYWSYCLGDQAKIVTGESKGFRGYIVGFDRDRNRVSLRRTFSGPTLSSHTVFIRHARW